MNVVTCDIETDGLDSKKIWVCVCKELGKDCFHIFRDGDADKAKEFFKGIDYIITHNGIGFDIPVLNRLWDTKIPHRKVVDTLVLSRLYDPLMPSHSLKSWGEVLGEYKDHYEDWSHYTQEMEEYCKQDVVVTETLYFHLRNHMKEFSKESKRMELDSQYVLTKQREYGFKLDRELAESTKNELDIKYLEIVEKLQENFPPRLVEKSVWFPKYTKDGELTKVSDRIIHKPTTIPKEDGSYSLCEWKTFSIDSPSEIVERLKDWWKPVEFTEKGQPKVSEVNLNTLREDAPQSFKDIKTCKIYKSRSTLIQSFLDACGDDGRVHGQVRSIGAATGRMSHSNPNTANVPSRGLYGEVCRRMYTVDEGRALVGCDASGIQLRALCHYLQNDELRHNILYGDMHVFFAKMYGLIPANEEYDESNPVHKKGRSNGKTCTYAIIMGAGVGRICSILGSKERGVAAFKGMERNLKGFKKFKDHIAFRARIGNFEGLDGRIIPLKSAHYGMSSYLQSFEAVIMKRAMIQSYKEVTARGLDAHQVAIVHDEMQYDCAADVAEEVGNILRNNIIEAGKYFNVFCPLDGEYKIGKNWAETH